MSMSDPVADMLTRIRNAQRAALPEVTMPASKMKAAIARTLQREGYVAGHREHADAAGRGLLTITLRYYDGKPVISALRRVSTPGLRIYRKSGQLPVVLGGMGTVIVSTSQGVMSGREARTLGHGGEIVCEVE